MSDEIMRADPARRRAVLIVLLVCFAVGVLVYGLVGDPFEWLRARMLAYVATESDPAEAQAAAARMIAVLLGFAWLVCAVIVGVYVLIGIRMWSADQWPPPGARPLVDQRIRRGRVLKVSAVMLMVVPSLALAALTYYLLRVAIWAVSGMGSD